MSDIFDFNGDYENPSQQNVHTQSRNEYWSKKNERRAQLNAEYQQDLDRYSVNISQEDYNIIKDAIANAEVPEDEAYRWACAMELNKQYDMPIKYAYQNLEQINAAKWGDRFTFTPKTNFKAIVDSGRLGVNTLKMGRLGSKIMKAEMFGKTEYNNYLVGKVESLDDMMAEYAALEQDSAGLTDLEDRNFAIEALKFAAQSAPYTGYVAGVGLLGGLLSGGAGTAAAFAVSMDNAAGLEYMRLRQAGSDVGDAAGFAMLSGGLQALVETSLGNVAGALGKKSLGDLASQAVKNKITGNVFKRLAYNGTFKDLALRMGKEWLKENAEEGLEEVIQDLIEKGTDALAAELGGYEIEGLDAQTIARDAWENFKGGVMGSLILGLPASAIKGKADIKEFVNVRKLAEATPSLETFNKFTEDSTLWEGMSDEEKKNAQKTTWENAQARVEAAATAEAQKIAEGRDAAEGAEEGPVENEDGTTEANPVARNEAGRLYTSNDVSTDEAGNVTGGTFVIGDKTKSENNRYGYIKYSQDAEGNITIDTFKMTEGRDKLRAEAFDEFAREHPDVNIKWNATAPDLQDFKNELINSNPNGKKNGLNYYSTTDLDNVAARKMVADELRKNIHNVKKNADGSYTQTALSNKQIAAGITLIESAARRMNMGLNEYINKTFGNQIFGSREEFASASLAQGEDVNKKAGGMYQGVAQANWREVGQQIKAVIYAGEHADFSTWAHEMAHVFQNQLDGQLKADAEAAFNVQNGDWVNSTYTFKDDRTMSSAEAFAYGFQDWLETGKAESEQMRNIFQKFAEFIADCYNRLKNHLDFTPEIESVFNQLLDGDDTIMSKALKAAQEQDNEYRASLKRQAEEKQAAKEAEKEQAKKQAEAAREEASEGTEFTEAEPTAEELLNGIEEAENETKETTEEINAIDNALENTNLTDEQKEQIAETLKDESSTVVEKAEATTEAAESAYDENAPYDLFQNEGALLSQLIGEPSIRYMAESEIKTRILLDLVTAKNMEAAGKDAGTIHRATGWEKINDEWMYETDDSVIDILDKANINKNLNANPNQLIIDYDNTRRNLDQVLDAPELFNIYPILKNVRVSFYKAEDLQRSRLSKDGILLNTRYLDKVNGPTSIKASLVYEIQKLIHALDQNDNKWTIGKNIKEYIDAAEALDKEMRQAILNKSTNLNYDKAAIQDKIKNIMSKRGDEEARIVASRVLLNADQRKWKTLAQSKAEEDVRKKEQPTQVMHYQTIQDPDLLEKLNNEPTIKVYRAMQVIDGEYYPPMATVVEGKRVESAKAGDWIQADENPELAVPDIDKKTGKQKVDKDGNLKWKFVLDKGGKDSSGKALTKIPAAYNPYWHTSRSPLNDQFSSAYKRPNLVTVEVEVPVSELTSGYKAERAKDAVGEMDWHSGPVSSQLAEAGKPRKVILSRYCKIDRVIPDSEVAQKIKELLEGTDIAIPDNTITPSLKAELEKIDIKVEETEDVRDYNKALEEATKKAQELLRNNKSRRVLFQDFSEPEEVFITKYPELSKEEVKEIFTNDKLYEQLENTRNTIENEYKAIINDPAFVSMHIVKNEGIAGERQYFIHPSPRNDGEGKWQMSLFDDKGPYSHVTFDDLGEASRRGYNIPNNPDKVEVIYDDQIRYDKPYYDALENNNLEEAKRIVKEYAAKKHYTGKLDTEVTDATDIAIPLTKRFKNKWYTQADYNAAGREYSLLFQEEQIHTDAFKNWFGDWENDPQNASKVVDENGEPLVVYHGTYSGQFDVFDKNRANPENDFGKGFYFTDNDYDVSDNYEGGGPDFENKVSRLAERIQQDNEDLSYEEAEQQARDQLYVDDNLFEVYLSMKHPVYVGDNETDIVSELFDDIDVSEEDFDNEDDYYEELENARADRLEEVRQAILSSGYYGAEEAADKVMEFFYNGSGTLAELKEILNDGSIEVYDESDENYGFATNDIARIVAEALGYDGIIDTSVSEKFKNMNLDESTTHYIVFNPNQIKSATDNSGAFNPDNPSILFQDEYDPRSLVPNVRGGWTEKKIIKYLKDNPTLSGVVNAIRFIKEFDTPEELKAHMFYHGTALGSDKLKPSITMSDRDIERYGGGGYGQKYWSISVSKSKKVASNFAPMSDGVRIYPIILAKNAKVIEMPELTDSVELEDHIIDLWNQGVDAVWIGDKDSGEQELSILNPRAVVNIGRADWYKNYRLGSDENPINIKNDEQIKEMFDYAKNYERKTEADFGKPEKPWKKPSRYNFDDTRPSGDKLVPNLNYDTEIAEYNKAMEDYEKAVNDWYSSDDYKEWEKFDRERRNVIFFQEAYHGSGADFDKFDTENFGLSGEGSMSFGYGTYVTDNEDIARDYADRAGKVNYHYFYKGKEEIGAWNPKTLASAMYKHYGSIEEAIKNLEDFKKDSNEALHKAYYQSGIDILKESKPEDFGVEIETTRHLYTVEIPDEGYLRWDEPITEDQWNYIYDNLKTDKQREIFETTRNDIGYITGQRLIREKLPYVITETTENNPYLSNHFDKTVSKFLHDMGFAGIKYKAGTIYGNGGDAYNYVIFNEDDAKIVDKLLFQTNAELMDEAKSFESWQEFMDYCETFHADDEVSPIPGDADAQWYQTFWETSNGVKTEEEKKAEAAQAKNKKETQLPLAVDALFATFIRTDPGMVDSFLQAVADLDAIDLDSEEWQHVEDEEGAKQRERIEQLKDFINITLSDYNWQTAMRRVQGGHEISEGLRKRLIGEMVDNFKTRDFRALYAEVMGDEQYAVAPEDSITAILNKKVKKYHDIVKPNDDISRWSPERRKQLAEQLANRELAEKIRRGDLKLDDELDAYIKSLTKQIKDKQKQFDELEAETKADYQRIADKERRDLLKLHEQLLLARGKLNTRNAEIERKIKKGLKITEKYRYGTQNANADYDELFRKYSDLRNSITITAEVQAALDRQEQLAGIRDDLNAKQKEKNLTAEVKKMRIQLVKRTMRRVPFNRIDYESAKTVIAIQRMLEPNLLGGVNRFIGIDSPYLRGIISQIVTDSDYKEKIMNYLSKNTKASQAFADFKKKLTELKTIKDFDSWTAKDRKAAIRYLPKENWVRDLNLLQLAKEREESIDLDIGMEEYNKTVFDEKTGEPKTYKDAQGDEHILTETAFRLQYDQEIGRLVQDAVGADMFDKIVNMPFAEWTTEDLESLAQRIDEIYIEGRDLKAAKDEARKKEAAAIRNRIENAIKETGITINDDDPPEEKERKQKQIEKILGMSDDLKGTEAGKPKGLKARLNRLLHSYSDMNVLRFARMLDGQSEGENVHMLYRMEDDCYNKKQRSMNARAEKVYKVMQENGITEGDLAETVEFNTIGSKTEFTVDELLYFLAADKDYVEDEVKVQKGEIGLDANDDYAATSRNAVMFGNMMSDMMSQEEKESWLQLDKDMEEALQNDTLTQEQKEQLATGQLDKKPGTTRYIAACHAKWGAILSLANNYLSTHPEYKALMEAIEADYAEQYGRMNEVSINEFNMPVHRVKAYVPLVRRESNGDTNENQVKEDLLGAAGVGKQWADRGMTQRRVNISPLNQKPVQTGLFRTWADSIERTEHFIAYAPYVRQLNAVYKSRDAAYTRRFIESRYGAGAIKYLDEYINEVANPNAGRIRERGAEWLHVLRGKTAPAYLGWKASAIIKQGLTSPWPYMQFVNPAEYVSAAMKFTFNPEMREAIKEKSVFMKMRRMDPVNDLIDEMADNAKTKLDRGWSNFSKLGMQGLELIDWACVAPGWLACYEKKYNQLQNASNARYEAKMAELKERNMYAEVGTSEYLTPQQMEAEARKELAEDIEAEAVRYADDCTRACQPSNRVTDLAPLFKNSSEAMKAFLQFQTSLNVIWQNIRYDMPYAVKNKEFTRIAGTVIGYVMAGIFMNSVMEGIGGDDDDDETQALRNLIYYSTTQFTDAIPIMGSEITNTMDQLITGKRGFYGSGTDMTPSATKLLSALTSAKKGNWEKAASITAEGIGLYLGAPVSGAKEINKLLGKPLSEGDVNLKRGISDVYGIAGDILEE